MVGDGPSAGTFGPALSQAMKDGLSCMLVPKHYLDHKDLYPKTCGALKNVLMLNYDNYLNVVEDDYLPGKTVGKIMKFSK